jgi:hypothetical protein
MRKYSVSHTSRERLEYALSLYWWGFEETAKSHLYELARRIKDDVIPDVLRGRTQDGKEEKMVDTTNQENHGEECAGHV